MKKSDFIVDKEFYTATGKWTCVSANETIITAIRIEKYDDNGILVPDVMPEKILFDDFDFDGCYLSEKEMNDNY